MGSKQTGTSTSTSNSAPWSEQQPYLRDVFSEAQSLYQGAPPQYYAGESYAPWNDLQTEGLNDIISASRNAFPFLDAAYSFNNDLLGGRWLNSNPAMGLYGSFAGENIGENNLGTPTLYGLANTNLGYNAPGDVALQSYLSGERLNMDNPYTDRLVESITSRVLPGIQSRFISGGTLSSPEAARASAEGVTSAVAPHLFDQYQREEANQIAAANALSGRYLQGGALQGSVANMLSNAATQGRGLQQQAAGGLSQGHQSAFEDMMRGLALSPQTFQMHYQPGQNIFGAGLAQQQFDQQRINDAVARWNFEQTMPWDMLNQYIGQVTGNYGGTTTMTQPFYSNPVQSALGGIGAVASIFGRL